GKPQSWVIDRGVLSDPLWSADGTRILAIESPHGGEPTLLTLNVTDGSRRALGHDTAATASADATVVARGSRLLRLVGGKTTVLASHGGGRVESPVAAPDGAIAYAGVWGTQIIDMRILPADGGPSKVPTTRATAPGGADRCAGAGHPTARDCAQPSEAIGTRNSGSCRSTVERRARWCAKRRRSKTSRRRRTATGWRWSRKATSTIHAAEQTCS